VDRYRVGCTGWSYEDWKGPFYPEAAPPGEYLERYARVFSLTEVDSSFYRPPTPFLIRRWASVTPDHFEFSLKLPRIFTHDPVSAGWSEELQRFLGSLEPLRTSGKLGPLVGQFPPSFRRPTGEARLKRILDEIPRDYRLAIELRHDSWWTPETQALLAARPASLVWSVYPGVEPRYWVTADFLYSRFVGDRALTKFDHIQRDLRTEMERMKKHYETEGLSAQQIFALVNNHFMGYGPGTARILQEVLGAPLADLTLASRRPGVPPLTKFGSD
jgi:uncharacterized protein YecE (DUF72 family)